MEWRQTPHRGHLGSGHLRRVTQKKNRFTNSIPTLTITSLPINNAPLPDEAREHQKTGHKGGAGGRRDLSEEDQEGCARQGGRCQARGGGALQQVWSGLARSGVGIFLVLSLSRGAWGPMRRARVDVVRVGCFRVGETGPGALLGHGERLATAKCARYAGGESGGRRHRAKARGGRFSRVA